MGHEADELTETQDRFQDAAVGKAELLQQRIHRTNDHGRGVVGVQGGGTGGVQFVRREQRLQAFAFGFPTLVVRVKDLWQPAPTDVADEGALVLVVGRHAFAFECEPQFNRGEVGVALLLECAGADAVGIGDAVISLIARRFGFGRRRCFGDGFSFGFYSSGGRKRYRSRTISQARWAA